MRHKLIILYLAILSVITQFFYGCSADVVDISEKKPGVYIGKIEKTVDLMGDDDVIVSINGVKITKKDFLSYHDFYASLYRVVNFREGELDKKAAWFAKANEQRVIPMLMRAELIRQAAKDTGITVSADEIEEAAKVLLPKYGLRFKRFSDAKKKFDLKAVQQLNDIVYNEALTKKTVRKLARESWFTVSAQEVTNRLVYIKKFNENAEKMNLRAREQLLKARKEILDGALFADVARKYSEVQPDQGKEWMTVELDELSSEGEKQLLNWLTAAEMGDISEPIDFDDGISIVGVARKGEREVPEGVTPPILYTLVRCTMYARQKMETPTYKEVFDHIKEVKENRAMNEVGESLHNKAVIEFPNGTNFFNTVSSQKAKTGS